MNCMSKGQKLPDSYEPEHKYTWTHNQGDRPTCVLHSWAYIEELKLADIFKQKIMIDVDEIWDRMLSAGLADENGTQIPIAINFINSTYYIFQTENGIRYWWFGNKVELMWEESVLLEEGVLKIKNDKVVPRRPRFEAFIDVMSSKI